MGIANIADELGMSRSTTHRYVLTLTKLGYLIQDAKKSTVSPSRLSTWECRR